MSKIAIVYWSGTGNTEMMAKEIAAGAQGVGGDVSIFHTTEFSADSAAVFEKFALGCHGCRRIGRQRISASL